MATWEFDLQFVLPTYTPAERVPVGELPEFTYETRNETVAIEDKNSWRAYWNAKRAIKERYTDALQIMVIDERRIDLPTRKPKAERLPIAPISGYVYLLAGGGYHKIGLTTDLDVRIKAIASGLPFEIEVVCVIRSDDIVALEKTLHRYFKEQGKHVRAEWFTLSADDVDYVKSLAGGA